MGVFCVCVGAWQIAWTEAGLAPVLVSAYGGLIAGYGLGCKEGWM